MLIKKYYKFYAGHRNQDLKDKCSRPHGHFYQLSVFFEVKRTGSISTLFNDFDSVIEPFLKNEIDHRFFLDKNDTLFQTFEDHKKNFSEDLGAIILPFPSSVENVSFFLFDKFTQEFKFNIDRVELQETSSSTLIYTKQDYQEDLEYGMFNLK